MQTDDYLIGQFDPIFEYSVIVYVCMCILFKTITKVHSICDLFKSKTHVHLLQTIRLIQ